MNFNRRSALAGMIAVTAFAKFTYAQSLPSLGEITVYGSYSDTFDTWSDCVNIDSGNAYAMAMAHAYLMSDQAWTDFETVPWTPAGLQAIMKQQCYAYVKIQEGVIPPQAIQVVLNNWNALPPYSVPGTLTGGIWSAWAAGAHWLFGQGQPLSIDINNIGFDISMSEVGSANKLSVFISNNTQPGTYYYDSGQYGYSSYSDSLGAALLIGGASLQTTGNLTRNADGSFQFSGLTIGFPDVFNFEPRADRPMWAEGVTAGMRAIGGTDFTININGQLPTNFQGN